jgi:hypothetical protein
MAVAITGTVHATPAITLRRLTPCALPPLTFAFRTSDKSAPKYVFQPGRSLKTGRELWPGFPGFAYSFEAGERFLQPTCKVRSRSGKMPQENSLDLQ